MTTHPETAEWLGGRRALLFSLAAGIGGLLLLIAGALVDLRQALFSYLAAFAAALWTALGALSLIMIAEVTGATWFVVIRRVLESIVATFPLLAALALPILIGANAIYPWIPPLDELEPHVRRSIEAKRGYLNFPFFAARAALYFAIWIALAELLRRRSLRRDVEPTAAPRSDRIPAAVGLIVLAFTGTFAAFDWLMSLSPAWASTIYGVYLWAGGMVGALALVAVLSWLGQRGGALTGAVGASHSHALGRLLLTFVAFWVYVAFSQYLIIWIGDLPHEIGWYATRTSGTWRTVALTLVAGHFALPFLVLLMRWVKDNLGALTLVSGWLIAMHIVDAYWLVLPELHPHGAEVHWLDFAALAAVGGLTMAFGIWRRRGHAALPSGDPRLARAIGYRASARA